MTRPAILVSIVLLSLAVTARGQSAATRVHYTFSQAEAWTAEKLAEAFQLNQDAKEPKALQTHAKRSANMNGWLELTDVGPGIPHLTVPLTAPAASGRLELQLGTNGTQGQHVGVELMRGKTILAALQLHNNTTGALVIGKDKSRTFYDAVSWYRNVRRFVLSWEGADAEQAGRVSLRFEPKGEDLTPITFEDVTVAAAGRPDAIRFRAGFNTGVTKGLVLDELKLDAPARRKAR